MAGAFVLVLIGLELKHFLADYVLQSRLMMTGKGSLTAPGGYLHAGVHVLGSLAVLALAGIAPVLLLMLLAAEFVIHYGLDYAKVGYGRGVHAADRPKRFWILHGLDQLLHQLTYAGMLYFAFAAAG